MKHHKLHFKRECGKNYLTEGEISELNRIVVMCLDYAEDQAKRRKQIFLQDWEGKINQFLEFHERNDEFCHASPSRRDPDNRASAFRQCAYRYWKTRKREF
ncbi:MAG: virulence RhuM family protein [Kiritimatiellaeota bacterium]|nr:virulence RhuM family protein [Kiritimatiellota bacterium]